MREVMNGFTHAVREILIPRFSRMTAVSPSIDMKRNGPSDRFDFVRYTSTGDQSGSSRSFFEISCSFGFPGCLMENSILLFSCWESTA